MNHPSFAAAANSSKVLVYNQNTLRLVGGERDFSREAFAKFGVACDLTQSMLKDVAAENLWLFHNDEVALKVGVFETSNFVEAFLNGICCASFPETTGGRRGQAVERGRNYLLCCFVVKQA